MTERASIFQTTQLGVETTPGTSVAANKLLQSMSVQPAIQADIKRFRAAGRKYASLAALGKEYVQAGVEGLATYEEIVYAFSSAIAYAAPVKQGATAAYQWTFSPATGGPDTVKTYTIEQGSSVRAHKFTHALFTGVGMSFTRDEIKITGDLIAKALQDGITMTSSPTALAMTPILPTQVDVFLADTQAGLTGATALSRVMSAEFSISNRQAPVWPLGSANNSGFAAVVETEPGTALALKMAADAEGMGLLTPMRSGAVKFVRIKAEGATIESTYKYQLIADFCVRVTSVDEFSDEDGLFAIGFGFEFFHDATWGKAFELSVMNTVTAL